MEFSFAVTHSSQRASGQHFDRYVTLKLLVVSAVNNPHASCTNLLDDAIVAERLADELERCGH